MVPGLDADRTLLYALELKRYATRLHTDRSLQTDIRGLYVAGDGAGVARGIGGAAATGEIAARGIYPMRTDRNRRKRHPGDGGSALVARRRPSAEEETPPW